MRSLSTLRRPSAQATHAARRDRRRGWRRCGLELNRAQDAHRVLQGLKTARGSHEHDAVRLPRLHVPSAAGAEQVRRRTSSTSLPAVSGEAAKTGSVAGCKRWRLHLWSGLDPRRPRADDQLVRCEGWINYYGLLLPVASCIQTLQPHQRQYRDALGHAEIQTACARHPTQSSPVPGWRSPNGNAACSPTGG